MRYLKKINMENYASQEIMTIPCFILVNFNQTKTALG